MRVLLRPRTKGDREERMDRLLHELKNARENPAEGALFRYFEFDKWCESKLTGVPFREIVVATISSKHG